MAGIGQGMVEDRRFDLRRHAVRVRPARAGRAVDQPLRAEGLEVAADFVELLAGVTHQLASLRDIVEIARQFEQRELAACYFLLRGHGRFLRESDVVFGDTI
jgi:hypothetical protein